MAEQIVLVAGTRAATLDIEPFAGLDEDGAPFLLEAAEEGGDRTPSARDSACKVVSDGEVMPFSIFDSMPSEMSVATARSATVYRASCGTPAPRGRSPLQHFSRVSRMACGFCVSGARMVLPYAETFGSGFALHRQGWRQPWIGSLFSHVATPGL